MNNIINISSTIMNNILKIITVIHIVNITISCGRAIAPLLALAASAGRCSIMCYTLPGWDVPPYLDVKGLGFRV